MGVDFSRCYGHDGETCSVECIPGFSVTAPFMTEPTITCTSGQWDNTEPCRFGMYSIDVYTVPHTLCINHNIIIHPVYPMIQPNFYTEALIQHITSHARMDLGKLPMF